MKAPLKPATFRKKVLAWFAEYGRHDLPWQKNQTPYRVWVSEIMLQQTQVSAVIPYFNAFIRSFPTVKALAAADSDFVLKHWSGLGYYARARNLHRTAQVVVNSHKGRFPRTLEGLSDLPGIGRSTAGAILSLAMGQRAAILDGNVKRVLARYFAISGWGGDSKVAEKLWSLSEQYTPTQHVGDYNQVMMDLGATLCTRSSPGCVRCPLNTSCQAYQMDAVLKFPEKKPKKAIPKRKAVMLILCREDGALLLQKRNEIGIWGGLWSFPQVEKKDEVINNNSIINALSCNPVSIHELETLTHKFSHFELAIQPLLVHVKEQRPTKLMESDGCFWYKKSGTLPGGIPAPVKKILRKAYEQINQMSEVG